MRHRAAPTSRRELQALDGEPYSQAIRLATEATAAPAGYRQRLFVVMNPRLVPAYLTLLLSVPTVLLEPGPGVPGQRLRALFASESWRKAAAHSVLHLPATREEFLRGRPRESTRRGMRQAQAAGLSCRLLPLSEHAAVVEAFASSPDQALLLHDWRGEIPAEGSRLWAIDAADGEVVGLACALVDRDTAVLRFLLGPQEREVSSGARYLLQGTMACDLIDLGVRCLVTVDAMFSAPGLRHFAARVGFVPARVQLSSPLRVRVADGVAALSRQRR